MNGEEEKKNVLFVCLDSCRYDTFMAARAPNMKAIGPVRKVHSFACWTVPSMVGYLLGVPPIGLAEEQPGGSMMALFDCERMKWAPREFMKMQYYTIFKGQNSAIANYALGSFDKGFMDYNLYVPTPESEVTETIALDLEEKVTQVGHPVFAVLLLMDTHTPYHWGEGRQEGWHGLLDGDPEAPKKNFDNQVKAIEYVDRIFPRFIEPFKEKGKTVVTVTSDHGDLHGPTYFSHSPTYKLRFDEDLFKIPFIRGEI